MKYLFAMLAGLVLAACAGTTPTLTPTLTATQCDANWAIVGERDGAAGARQSKLDDYRAACAKSGAPLSALDEADWSDGWRDGIDDFCRAPASELNDVGIRRQRALCQGGYASGRGDYGYDGYDDGYGDGYGRGRIGGPTISPSIGVGVGSGGVRVGGGVGIGLGVFNLGF